MFFQKNQPKRTYRFDEIFRRLLLQLETLEKASENVYEILKTIISTLEAKGGSLFLFQIPTKIFALKKWVGEKPLNVSVTGDYEFIDYLKRIHSPLFKDEVLKDGRFLEVRPAGIHYFTQLSCVAVVPLIVKNQWVGLLNLGRNLSGRDYTEEDRGILSLLGYWLAHNLSNAHLYDEVQAQNKKLSEITEMKNELMANVTHELRTPLNGIMGLTSLVLEGADGEINEEQKRHLEMIHSAGESLLEIVNNILSLIKIDSGKGVAEIRRLDLVKIVGEIANLFEGIFENASNHFQFQIPRDLTVYGNEDQVRTILMNLMGNAAKFTKNGQIEIFAQRSGDMAKICVKDTGIGIVDEDQIKIFEEFRQGDGSITRSHGGTGLGLAITKKIVEMHGGRIWVDSIHGKGSEFYFTLPTKPVGIPSTEVA